MIRSKHRIVILLTVVAMTAMLVGQIPGGVAAAAPTNPTDGTKVPHYFGPYPNWANSPLTLPDVAVDIQGDGTGATATATVGARGSITGVTITNPGSGYTAATIVFTTTGAGTGASADAVITSSGAVSSVQVDAAGGGYVHPAVAFSGGAPDATGTVFGGVDALSLVNGGAGYHVPTVAFDMPDDPNGTVPTAHVLCAGDVNGTPPYCTVPPLPDGTPGEVSITGIVLDTPGSGYTSAPGVAILDGTQFEPVRPPGTGAAVSATLSVQSIVLDTFGAAYTANPVVAVTDKNNGPGTGAQASATTTGGTITGVANLIGGSGYVTTGGIKKFQDQLPLLCDPDPARAAAAPCLNDGTKEIPLAVADPDWTDGTNTFPTADTYEIALVQYEMSFSSSLPPTLVRGYVQIQTPGLATRGIGGAGFPLTNTLRDGTKVPATINGVQAIGVTLPQYLGPTIVAVRDRATRIVFHNLLPTHMDGDLFLPTDTTMMGAGMGPLSDQTPVVDEGTVMDGIRNPMCTEGYMGGMPDECFTQNRATLHLHGGITPWISDGTPHQWVTPAGEGTSYPQGVSVENVPDMNVCGAVDDGCQTFYYTNQQSARLMFYHDHAWGITRLNVYAGEAAGYLLTDDVEGALMGAGGALEGLGLGAPLVIQDRTFVPSPAQMAQQDPTWDYARWGDEGDLWYHHVYMPAQNPGDPSGMSSFGRWMYGPWFWPPASPPHGPIDNPYYDAACDLNVPSTWTYQTDPFCEPKLIPGTPNISVGMEQFNDTPIVNGAGVPDDPGEPAVVPVPDPERGQRPLLEPAVVRGGRRRDAERPDGRHRGRAEGERARRRSAGPERVPHTGHEPQPRGAEVHPDRQRGRVPPGPRGRSEPADHLDHRPDALRRRERGPARAPARARREGRRDRRLLGVPGQDADPVQRRSGCVPGQGLLVRLLHGRPRPDAGRRAEHPARIRAEHPDHHAGDGVEQRSGCSIRPGEAERRVQAPRRTGRACSSPVRTRSSSGRPPTTRRTARTSLPADGAATLPWTRRVPRRRGATGSPGSRRATTPRTCSGSTGCGAPSRRGWGRSRSPSSRRASTTR